MNSYSRWCAQVQERTTIALDADATDGYDAEGVVDDGGGEDGDGGGDCF